jgi:hypothetical protein
VVILETGIGFQKSVLTLTNLQAENLHNFLAKSDNYFDTYRSGFQSIDYFISLDMARELSMVENNAQGKIARRYFIECEKER